MPDPDEHENPGGDSTADRGDADSRAAEQPPPRPAGRGRVRILALLVLAAAAALTAVAVASRADTPAPNAPNAAAAADTAAEADQVVAPAAVTDAQLAALPQETTFADLPTAPKDPAPGQQPDGLVLHPRTAVPLYSKPGAAAIAALPPTQLGSDTWVPVIGEQPGWALVLLPGRPNGSTAWLYRDDPRVDEARTPYVLRVDRAAYRLELVKDGATVRTWTVGVGKPVSPTPAGRAFVLASIRDTKPTFSPIVLPLSVHSDTYTTYGGGPGTVGVHGWPTDGVYGKSSSDGCIRVPPDALNILSSDVPLGTPVLIR
ncbi:L,D-transpeptidase catalytic domain [Amycolatopsis rubida]|uniref:L,D-transpeptidase catalytic domain n=2 Tax=Amycolatopsis rubida TaxID=112413 RepID=A0A1I5XEN8_9PSEU|nr:L,D-transpeptidase catalytic domain [Amycolatopsis rubida]